MEIPFTTMGHFIAVIFVSVRCIVVLLLTLGREHTGENTFVVMLRSMTNLLSYFKCKHFVSINQDIWILPTSSPNKVVLSKYISLYDEDVVCLGCEMEMVVMAQ